MKDDYKGALERARAEGKRVLVNFTGYACTNCHWMKANMFPRPEIAAAMQDFVRVELYMDGLDAKSEEHVRLQETKFKTFTMPYYAILDPDERVIATSGYTTDTKAYLAFLTAK
jgi:thiol:disulfide interchange protein DsbD